jgi:hypothetical protein
LHLQAEEWSAFSGRFWRNLSEVTSSYGARLPPDYGTEKAVEVFYTTHIWRGLFASFDVQHVNNSSHDMARGPVTIPGLHLHTDF